MPPSKATRVERDTIGTIAVPADACRSFVHCSVKSIDANRERIAELPEPR
ncbi:MAG TPA: hypothetical protein VKB68_01490 [Stellaceae bacterium]|nr:hypothetical protein [Stellaceae bacterium]